MANKKSNNNLLGLLAFTALLISGVCFILSALGIGGGILSLIGQIALTIVVLWEAWEYAKHCDKTWRIIFYVLAVLAIAGLIFGGFKL